MRIILMASLLAGLPVYASATTLKDCAGIANDAERVACYDRLAGRDPDLPISEYAAMCEAALVQRLVAPTGYRRVNIDESRSPIPLDQYVDQEMYAIRDRNLSTPEKAVEERAALREEEARLKANGQSPTRVAVTITYDSPNRMNAVIRNTEVCTALDIPE